MRKNSVVSLTVFLALASTLLAQAPTATLVGRVVDSSRAGVPGAAIKVRNLDTNQTRPALTSETGDFTVSALPPGPYEVSVEKSGFKTVRETKLVLEADQSARLDVELPVGSVSESVEVTAAVPLLNTETPSPGHGISPTAIADAPPNG